MRADQDHTVLITIFLSQMSDIEYGDDNLALLHKGKSLYFRDHKILIFNIAGTTHEKLKKMNCQRGPNREREGKYRSKILTKSRTSLGGLGASESLRALDVDVYTTQVVTAKIYPPTAKAP